LGGGRASAAAGCLGAPAGVAREGAGACVACAWLLVVGLLRREGSLDPDSMSTGLRHENRLP